MPYIIFYKSRYSSRSADESLYIYDSETIPQFPNKKKFIQRKKEELGLTEVSITSIIEVTEEQADYFNK